MFDVRLKENFKLFVSGPSRCGKTFFIADLLQNITKFAKQPPTLVVYIYKVWQSKFDEMRKLVHVFLKDEDDLVDRIKEQAGAELCQAQLKLCLGLFCFRLNDYSSS